MSESTECTKLRVNPNINYVHLITSCQGGFINFNKYTTLVKDTDNGGYACVEAGSLTKISNLYLILL